MELAEINDFINKNIEPHWNNSNTAKMVRTLETLTTIEKLIRFVNRLNKLDDNIRKDIMQGYGNKMWSVHLPVCSGIACVSSLFSGNPPVIILTSGFGSLTGHWSFQIYN